MPTLVDELKRGLSFVRKQAHEQGQRRDGRLKVGPSISAEQGERVPLGVQAIWTINLAESSGKF